MCIVKFNGFKIFLFYRFINGSSIYNDINDLLITAPEELAGQTFAELLNSVRIDYSFGYFILVYLSELESHKMCVCCIFILLSRESDQCAMQARLRVASHLSTTPRWGNLA